MGNVDSIVSEPSASTSFADSPSDSPAIVSESAEYVTGQEREICFGMVSRKFSAKS